MIVAKSMNPILARQRGLRLAGFRHAQVIEAEVRWKLRLIMALEERTGLGNVDPLRKSLSPPGVVFRNGVILRKVKGDGSGLHGRRDTNNAAKHYSRKCLQKISAASMRGVAQPQRVA